VVTCPGSRSVSLDAWITHNPNKVEGQWSFMVGR
jgi:hypothetical protein